MADSYTASLRLTQPQVNASLTWPTSLNADMALIDTAIAGRSSISINGLTTYTLTATNGAADQARQPVWIFTGTLAAACTVTIPAAVKFGWVINNTTGGFAVVLTTGSGTTASVSGNTTDIWTFFQCDGTNVTFPDIAVDGLSAGAIGAASLLTTGAVTVTTTLTANAGVFAAGIANTGGMLNTVAALGDTFHSFVRTGTGTVGSILSTLGGGTSYNTTSDYRLKVVMGRFDPLDIIDLVPVHEGYFRADPTAVRAMFLAHELAEVAPWAVTGEKDAVTPEGNVAPQQVDHSVLLPVLWAELQRLRVRVHALENGIIKFGGGR